MKRFLAALLPIVIAAGCAPARHRIAGEEAAAAAGFFAASAAVAFPVRASFSGYAEFSGTAAPLLAAVDSWSPSEETVGLYDPLGGPLLFLENDGTRLRVVRGEAARAIPRIAPSQVAAGPISLARVLSGAPGYPIGSPALSRGADGGWILSDGRQSLFSDPARRVLERAEYEVGGERFVVVYPGRAADGAPPPSVAIEGAGAKIVLRRDAE